MYEAFFNLQRRPFSTTPDPNCVHLAGSAQTAVDELVVCLERGEGIAVLTAPAGLGKTLLCEKVRQELGPGFATVLLRHGNFSSPADLLRTLLAELGCSSAMVVESDLRRNLIAALRDLRQRGQLLAVLCDEAHCLAEPVLEELRQLVDHADRGVSWVRLMLTGQLELEEKLAEGSQSALNQRLRAHVTLASLSAQESLDYIDYRITWAGGRTEEIFQPDALTAIADAADGVPRCLNQLCDHVLLLAYVAEQRPVPLELVAEALSDLQHLPLSWNLRSVRQPTDALLSGEELSAGESVGDAPEVEFGDHLHSWLRGSYEPANWGGNRGPHRSRDEAAELEADTVYDPVGQFFDAVEHELDNIAPDCIAPDNIAPDKPGLAVSESELELHEEPVIDRYAAIDAGWPPEEIPIATAAAQAASETKPLPVSAPASIDALPMAAAEQSIWEPGLDADEPEERLQSDVLELSSSMQGALQSRRIHPAKPSAYEPSVNDESSGVVETDTPRAMADRPFRNLFTRLRRKQKGLE